MCSQKTNTSEIKESFSDFMKRLRDGLKKAETGLKIIRYFRIKNEQDCCKYEKD